MKVNSGDKTLQSIVSDLSRYVPYRFLAPWFAEALRGVPDQNKNNQIILNADSRFNQSQPVIYKFKGNIIELNLRWKEYLLSHLGILTGFAKYKMLQ